MVLHSLILFSLIAMSSKCSLVMTMRYAHYWRSSLSTYRFDPSTLLEYHYRAASIIATRVWSDQIIYAHCLNMYYAFESSVLFDSVETFDESFLYCLHKWQEKKTICDPYDLISITRSVNWTDYVWTCIQVENQGHESSKPTIPKWS